MLFQLLECDYIQNQKPIIRMFGKTEKNTSACFFYEDFYPYFYVEGKEEEIIEALKDREEVAKIEKSEKFSPIGYQKKPINVLKITTKKPEDVARIREFLEMKKCVKTIYEADILFKYRFLIDQDICGMDWLEVEAKKIPTKTVKVPSFQITKIKKIKKDTNAALKYLSLDIECLPKDFSKPIDPKEDPIIMISLAFKPKYRNADSLVLVAKSIKDEKLNIVSFKNEEEILKKFLEIVDQFDPDIITGYNIQNFDLPYLIERLKQNKLPQTFGRCNIKPAFTKKFGALEQCVVPGRVVFDPYQILKMDPWIKFKHYDLNTVAKELLGEEKVDIKYREMEKYWNGDKDQLKKFILYSQKDAELALKLVIDKGLMDKFFELSKISGLLLQDSFGGQSIRVEVKMMHEFKKRNILMLSKPTKTELDKRIAERERLGLTGAVVLEPKVGLHIKGCTLVLDFTSLYPSIIRTYNISTDTLIKDEKELDENERKYIETPTGVKFIDPSIYIGTMPKILETLIERRAKIKKEIKKTEGTKKRILNATQLALKDMSNSFYGYTGFVMARLYLLEIANAITAIGRENLFKTKKMIEEKFHLKVIYADTDSVFLETNITNLDEAKKMGEEISKYVSEALPGCLELKFEKVFRTFLILTKKRYAGWSFEQVNNEWKDQIETKGIETIRRDWCELTSETMNNVLELILKHGDIKKATDYVKEVIRKLKNNEIPLEKLAIVKGITKSISSYKGVLPHIELAKKLAERHPENPPKIGDRIGFVIIAGNAMLSKRAEDIEYVKEKGLSIDSNYYISNQILPPIERIMRAVGVTKTELLGGGHQISINEIMKERKSVEKVEIKKDEATKLDGWEEFVCEKCEKRYKRMPLKGSCKCGGKIMIHFRGSLSKICKQP
ncbi:MAG: DNA polymerase domain-containing protein [Candidatus Aenigmatarchaeota archaeon]